MIFRRSERFKHSFKVLPASIQKKAVKSFTLFAENPGHPSLQIKKIKGFEQIWEGHIDRQYRFTFQYGTQAETGEIICVFRNVDSHDECLKNP